MNRKNSIQRNYLYNVCCQILTIVIPLITTPYISHVLEADRIGDYSFTASIVSYFLIFAVLGTLTYGNREISYLQDNRGLRSRTFWEIECLSLFATLLCLLVYAFFLIFCNRNLFPLYAVQSISILCAAFDITWLFQGMEEFRKIAGRNVVIKLFTLLFVFTMVRSQEDLLLYVTGLVLLNLTGSISLWFMLPAFVDRPDFRNMDVFRHLKPTLRLFIPTVAISIYTVLDKTMIGLLSNNYENGYYEQTQKITLSALALATSLGTVIIPRMGYYFNQKNMGKVQELAYQSYRFVMLAAIPASLGLASVADNLVPWFYGDSYQKITLLLPLSSLLIVPIGISNVTGFQYFVTTRRERLLTITVSVGALMNFICNLILIPEFASVGAYVASLLAECSITALQLFLIRRELSIGRILFDSRNYLLAGILMALLLRVESHYLSSSVLHTLEMIVSGGGLYFLVLFLLRDSFLLQGIEQLINKLRRR